jgi:uncharacterized protein Veg
MRNQRNAYKEWETKQIARFKCQRGRRRQKRAQGERRETIPSLHSVVASKKIPSL